MRRTSHPLRSIMQSVWSFYGSQLHLVLDDEVAERYNRVSKAFANVDDEALQNNPEGYFRLEGVDNKDLESYNAIADIINKLIEINGGSLAIPEEDMLYDCLVKV